MNHDFPPDAFYDTKWYWLVIGTLIAASTVLLWLVTHKP